MRRSNWPGRAPRQASNHEITDWDREQFWLQTEQRSWHLLWWEKETQMNNMWHSYRINWPSAIGRKTK